jgi:hypothetical protein
MAEAVVQTSRGAVVMRTTPDTGVKEGVAYIRDFFTVSANITFTALNERRPVIINIPADADFVAVKSMRRSSDAAPAFGGCFVQITDSGADRRLTDLQVPVDTIFGTGQEPFIWPWVHRFARNGNILLDVTNTGAAAQQIFLVIAGYKLIPASRL